MGWLTSKQSNCNRRFAVSSFGNRKKWKFLVCKHQRGKSLATQTKSKCSCMSEVISSGREDLGESWQVGLNKEQEHWWNQGVGVIPAKQQVEMVLKCHLSLLLLTAHHWPFLSNALWLTQVWHRGCFQLKDICCRLISLDHPEKVSVEECTLFWLFEVPTIPW